MSGGALALAAGVADVGTDDMPPLGAGTRDAGEFALDAGVGAGTAANIRKSRTHQHHAAARKRLEREAVENKAKWQEKVI
jgi:hypothetical protein